MKLKLAVATLLATLLIVLPVEVKWSRYVWAYDPAHYAEIVQWAGCTAAVDVDPTDSIVGSFYVPGLHVMHIGTRLDDDVPYYTGLIVLLHETGHCLQFQADPDGQILKYRMDPSVYELDADRRAAEMACGLGLDGQRLLHDVMIWAHDTFGYNGDPSHGTLDQRIHADDGGDACTRRIES